MALVHVVALEEIPLLRPPATGSNRPVCAPSIHRYQEAQVQLRVAAVDLIPFFKGEWPENGVRRAPGFGVEPVETAPDAVETLFQAGRGRHQFTGGTLGE